MAAIQWLQVIAYNHRHRYVTYHMSILLKTSHQPFLSPTSVISMLPNENSEKLLC